ncbi:hypothetical protein [Polyangium sp. 6x1]|uniref:hypothetical protein n=1 Tax=Polyangium sp. 6x1 TaxID=3042689 RepID=UPI002482C09B|nr:hypothetical protein [Polyangium sp. 6x1]MDI1450290.1 hypothetical protein [Polyangium sp. 6x1]
MRRASPSALARLVALPLLSACAPALQDPLPAWQEGPVGTFQAAAAVQIGGTGARALTGVAATSSGESVVVGHCSDGLFLSDKLTPCVADENLFLLELAPSGGLIASVVAGDLGSVRPRAVAARADGDIVLVGDLAGAFDFGPSRVESAGGRDAFLANLTGFSPGGDVLGEATRFGDVAEQRAMSVATFEDGGTLLAGTFSGTIDLGGDPLVSEGDRDVFVAARNAAGEPRFAARIGGPLAQQAAAIAATPDGGAVVVGVFEGVLDPANAAVVSAGGGDVFVAARGGAGEARWMLALGDTGNEEAAGVIVDPAGQTLVLGSFSGRVGRGAALTATSAERAAFVAAIDSKGALVKVRSFGETGVTRARAMARTPDGGAVIALDYTGRIEVGDRVFESEGAEDVLVLELDASLRVLRAGSFGDEYAQHATGIAVDGEGRIFLVGDFEGTLTVGDDVITAASSEPFWMRIE